jgi:8-oxo-dGTP diphosphatase
VREVEEETGLRCALGRELLPTRYTDQKDRPKLVRYWLMEVEGGQLRFEHEVDEARWLSVVEAAALLSYERDRDVLNAALASS